MIPRLSVRDGARAGALGACLLLLAAAPVSGFEIEQRNALRGVSAYDVDALVTFAAQVAFTRDGAITAAGLADSVEQIYREDGYLLAEARVAADGDTVIVDEGMIDRLEIEGVDARTFRTLEAIFRPVVGVRPLTQSRFERAVMLAEDMPDLDVAVEIDYPDDGAARLRVLATRFRKQAGSVTFDNPPRLLGEAASLYVEQEFYSLLSPGDFLRFELAGTREWDAEDADSLWGAVAYRTPLTANGLYGEVYLGSVAARRDVRGDFARTELEGETASVAIGFPLQRDIHRYGYALLDYRLASTESESGGTRLASEAAVLGLSYIYGHAFDSGAAMEAAVTLSLGEAENSEGSDFDDGDRTFWHLRAGAGFSAPLDRVLPHMAWRTEVWGQYTTDRLPSVEEYFLGDRYGLRGYRFDEANADSGVAALIEVSRSFFLEGRRLRRIGTFAFLDAGHVENNDPADFEVDSVTLVSTGIGLDFEFASAVYVSGYAAVPLRDGPLTDANSPAAYLSLTTSW